MAAGNGCFVLPKAGRIGVSCAPAHKSAWIAGKGVFNAGTDGA